jgi:hypothetical protein
VLADPCNAVLTEGFASTAEGLLGRLKTTYSPETANSFGYMLWCPHYVGTQVVGSVGSANCIAFTANSSSSAPTNAVPPAAFGGGADIAATNGFSPLVGATNFVKSSTVSDFRLVSACMKATYTGAMQDSQGMLAYIENVPADTLLLGNAGSPASIDSILNLATKVGRFGVDSHEVIFRPDQTIADTFKSDSHAVYHLVGGSQTTMTAEAQRFSPTMCGFVWIGVPTSDITFQFIQNIEWRPDAGSGYALTTPRQLRPPGYGSMVLKWLDDHYPGWTTSAKMAASAGARAAIRAFTGVASPTQYRIGL